MFAPIAYTDQLSFPKIASPIHPPRNSLSLVQRVESIPWESIVLPGAQAAFASSFDDLPRAHVVELPESIDEHWSAEECWNIDASPVPFLSDHYLVEAFKNFSVPIEEADFVILPFYQVSTVSLVPVSHRR